MVTVACNNITLLQRRYLNMTCSIELSLSSTTTLFQGFLTSSFGTIPHCSIIVLMIDFVNLGLLKACNESQLVKYRELWMVDWTFLTAKRGLLVFPRMASSLMLKFIGSTFMVATLPLTCGYGYAVYLVSYRLLFVASSK